jgi:predicted PhzF superfamily epimerase YddE/YHI9
MPDRQTSEQAESQWMQQVAAELNLSETAFVRRLPGQSGSFAFQLRWFTPRVEVDLCGHATLAAAHVLRETGLTDERASIAFHTRSGLLQAVPQGDAWEMDFPATPQHPVEPPEELLEALGTPARYVGQSRFDYLVELASEAEVRRLTPDFSRLARLATRGVIVTSPAAEAAGAYDFVSRFFAPACGIDEDPVTGSAHCCLGPFWAARWGRSTLVGYQASARGGRVAVRVAGDRVWLGGQAVMVLSGQLATH